jgi:actin-related protein
LSAEERDAVMKKLMLTGGASQMNGFAARLKTEFQRLQRRADSKSDMVGPIEYLSSYLASRAAYTGGMLLANHDHFREVGVNKGHYEQEGPACVKRFVF